MVILLDITCITCIPCKINLNVILLTLFTIVLVRANRYYMGPTTVLVHEKRGDRKEEEQDPTNYCH